MTGLLAHPFGTCQAPGCGKALPPPLKGSAWAGKETRRYCDTLCRSRAHHARNPRRRPLREVTCAICQTVFFQAGNGRALYCSKPCYAKGKKAVNAANLYHGDAAVRSTATERAKARVAAGERCPDCGGLIAADEALLYCRNRAVGRGCDWSELLTAKERDPRADTDTPDEDDHEDDQETEEMSLEEDTEETTTEDRRQPYAPTCATSRGEAKRAKIREILVEGPISALDLAARLGLDRSGVLRHLRAMPEAKSTGKGKKTLWQLVDEARPVEVKTPKAKPAPKPTALVELRRQIAEMSAADLDALLVDLSALAKAHADLRAAREALRG